MKKKITLILAFLAVSFIYAQSKTTVQVLVPESVNLSASDSAWLPGQIQDKLKSNMQEYLDMSTVVDSKSEEAVKKLQAQAEDAGRDEESAIELGKLTTAKFALFSKIRKSPNGYSISADFTDLTTGVQKASVSSKEYSQTSSLYGTTGAVDEITLKLAEKLGIKLSELNKNLLSTGSSSFSLDEQLELAKQNEVQFQKMIADYDADLARLSTSNDINAIQNKKKIEAEKALLSEKQNAEKKRQQDLKAQKERAEADARLDSERSIALKTQRDNLAKQAAAKAAEVRKAKIERQGILGFITTLESKKKALVEIRQSVEERSKELHAQMKKDEVEQALKILNANWTSVEMTTYGQPTEAAKQRRANKVWANNDALLAKFFSDCESVNQATMTQQNALVADINADYASLAKVKTVSSMGDELKVSYVTFDSDKYGWNAYLTLYSDGVFLFSDMFIVKYETLAGKPAPNMETATDAQLDEYANNVDMYNSLLARGSPILYFELDYNAVAAPEDKPSMYTFNFTKVRAINTVSGKVVQTIMLNDKLEHLMKPAQDLRKIQGIVAEEKENGKIVANLLQYGKSKIEADETIDGTDIVKIIKNINTNMIKIPGKKYEMLSTEVTNKIWLSIMGKESHKINYSIENDDCPVSSVNWEDVIRFCNKLSEICGFNPVYTLRYVGSSTKSGYVADINKTADGFRLPTLDEWKYAAKGGENYIYAGSNNLDAVAWYSGNSARRKHPVAQKKANGYGLYDMNGNVEEWCDEGTQGYSIPTMGGYYGSDANKISISKQDYGGAANGFSYGFRIVRTVSK